MSSLGFAKGELTAAVARGVRRCVVIGSRLPLCEGAESQCKNIELFSVDEEPDAGSKATFVPTQFESENLSSALEKSGFDREKATLFVWLEGAGYRTMEAVVSSLGFIASLPKGSGVLFDYVSERAALGSQSRSALDALASRVSMVGGRVKYLIDPQAVSAMLRGLGFQQIVDLTREELSCGTAHLVSAVV